MELIELFITKVFFCNRFKHLIYLGTVSDIYDEDRLMCGGSAGLQHNVCLAAVTFLAVLLTILYTVHYWLKRCVPKVSDAFFIYTDAAENMLVEYLCFIDLVEIVGFLNCLVYFQFILGHYNAFTI